VNIPEMILYQIYPKYLVHPVINLSVRSVAKS